MRRKVSRLIGYARVSTGAQDLKLQLDALRKAGCSKNDIYTDKTSGANAPRLGLDNCLRNLKPGDTLVIWRLDRLGRSVRHLIDVVDDLRQRGVHLKSICDGLFDTSSASGKLIFHFFTALAEFERSLIQERTRAGLVAARARGRAGGRKPLLATHPRVQAAQSMYADKKLRVDDICATLAISRATLYRYLSLR